MTRVRDLLSRRVPPPDLTVSYGSHRDQEADIRFPPPHIDRSPAPLLLLWHGGFWQSAFDRGHLGSMAADLANRGFVVANIEYRRVGGGGGWPATFADTADAVDRLPVEIERSAPGRVDWTRIVYAGHSAGGHLAVWAALRNQLPAGAPGKIDAEPRAVGVLALSPILDLARSHQLGLGVNAVNALLGGGPDEVPERYASADPAALGVPVPPVTLIHGDQDRHVPVEMSHRYGLRTGSRMVELSGVNHFGVIDPVAPTWPTVVNALTLLTGTEQQH